MDQEEKKGCGSSPHLRYAPGLQLQPNQNMSRKTTEFREWINFHYINICNSHQKEETHYWLPLDTKRHYVYDKRQIKDLTYTYGNTNNNNSNNNNNERQSPSKN